MDGYWILLGMMGAGKSTVGRGLAGELDVPFEDTDKMLEYRLGRPVSQLFALYGEEAFRGHETSVLCGIKRREGVLATGGGIILKEQNWEQFRRLGKTLFLHVPPEVLKERLRLSRKPRPLLQFDDWEDRFDQIYASRIEIYKQADLTVEVAGDEMSAVISKLAETCRGTE